jgi:hypothetical protein
MQWWRFCIDRPLARCIIGPNGIWSFEYSLEYMPILLLRNRDFVGIQVVASED